MFFIIQKNGKAIRFTKDINEVSEYLSANPGSTYYGVGELSEELLLEMRSVLVSNM